MTEVLQSANELIAALKEDASKYCLSPGELNLRIDLIAKSCGLNSLGATIAIKGVQHSWGSCNSTLRLQNTIDAGQGIAISIFADGANSSLDANLARIYVDFQEAMKSVWSSDHRKHGGIDLKTGDSLSRLADSVSRLVKRQDKSEATVVYLDLDHFKALNDNAGQHEGDNAIRKVYGELHKLVTSLHGLAFIDGGDEFVLIVPSVDVIVVCESLWQLKTSIESHEFGEGKHKLGMTAGVAIRPLTDIEANFAQVRSDVEQLTKSQGQKRRGSIWFELTNSCDLLTTSIAKPNQFFKLGVALSRSRHFVRKFLGDPRLNFLAYLVEKEITGTQQLETVGAVTRTAISWLGITEISSFTEVPLLINEAVSEHVPASAIALAVMHGVARGLRILSHDASPKPTHSLAAHWTEDGASVWVTLDSKPVWGSSASGASSLLYGPLIWTEQPPTPIGFLVGVQIGFDRPPLTAGKSALPIDLLADYVRVDDRPRSGGGLPDFWQVAIAQIVATCGSQADLDRVLVWGDAPENSETYLRLTGSKSWPVDEVAALANLSSTQVATLSEKLKLITVMSTSAEVLLDEIYGSAVRVPGMVPRSNANGSRSEPTLERGMVFAQTLEQSEGIICDTAAFAYPLVIDTLRKSPMVRLSRDDSDHELKELIAFKLKLKHPVKDSIPQYLQSQTADLSSYAQRVLLQPGGLLRNDLDSSGQIATFIDHLSSYLTPQANGRTTRRACLVVPHIPVEGQPRTLGLISVWATPRISVLSGKHVVDFVYVWRTVEAFIGLPYSLYGSIEFSSLLMSQVSAKLGLNNQNQIQIGELTYIALSIHIGSDEYHMRVAKRIVDQASD